MARKIQRTVTIEQEQENRLKQLASKGLSISEIVRQALKLFFAKLEEARYRNTGREEARYRGKLDTDRPAINTGRNGGRHE